VEKELSSWYPFLKEGSHIFIDDVDANPTGEEIEKTVSA